MWPSSWTLKQQDAAPLKSSSAAASSVTKPLVKPPAGLTVAKSFTFEEYIDSTGLTKSQAKNKYSGDIQNSWCVGNASTFLLRTGPDYSKNKLKSPSLPSFYEVVAVDFVKCESRIDEFGSRVTLPDIWTSISTNHPDVPPLIIVNVQLPSDFSSPLFHEVSDGDGWSLVLYYKITEATVTALADLARAPPALKLLVEYFTHAAPPRKGSSKPPSSSSTSSSTSSFSSSLFSTDLLSAAMGGGADGGDKRGPTTIPMDWMGRFKVTIRCENIEEFGLPSFITAYNAKPILIRNTGTLYRDVDNRYIEMDINVHKFSSVPKKALEVLFNRFDKMIFSIGFCIESRTEEEMPEALFGCVTLNRPTHTMAFDWNELTTG